MIKKAWAEFRGVKIVKFSDDTYGIRKGWLLYRYIMRNGSWGSRQNCYTSIVFEKVAKFYESRFVDEGYEVSYERIEQPSVDVTGHIEPEDKYYKNRWVEIVRCGSCGNLGSYKELGTSNGDCKICGHDRWCDNSSEEVMAKWEGNFWRIAQ